MTPWVFDGEGLASGLPEQAAFAEALGFDSLFLPESHFAGAASIPSPLLLLAGAAVRTQVQLGRLSVNSAEILAGLVEGDEVVLGDMQAWSERPRLRLR